MASVPSDYTIIGTVLAISVAIILLSGLALYISFRLRETLHEEKGRGARAVATVLTEMIAAMAPLPIPSERLMSGASTEKA